MLNQMGMPDVDDEILDSLQRQLFSFLEFENSLIAGGITFKTGCMLSTLQVQNYQEIRDQLHQNYLRGLPSEKMNLRLVMTSLCLYLKEDHCCQVTGEICEFQNGTRWHECEIVQASCEELNTDESSWK
ncbi:MAG: hypothetical protein ACFFFG_06305 [Candidatus Thorarchaeota archaeon]